MIQERQKQHHVWNGNLHQLITNCCESSFIANRRFVVSIIHLRPHLIMLSSPFSIHPVLATEFLIERYLSKISYFFLLLSYSILSVFNESVRFSTHFIRANEFISQIYRYITLFTGLICILVQLIIF